MAKKAIKHPKRKNPKKKIVSPKVSVGAHKDVSDYWKWFKDLNPDAQYQINSDVANLIKEIQRG